MNSESVSKEAIQKVAALRRFAAISGWRATSCDNYGIEFTRPKSYSRYTLICGGILLIIGIGLLLLIWGVFEYFAQRDEVLFITMSDILEKKVDLDLFK